MFYFILLRLIVFVQKSNSFYMKTLLTFFFCFLFLTNYSWAQVSAGQDQSVCSNSAQLSATPPDGYWSIVEGSGFFENKSANTTIVNGLTIGKNVFRWTPTKQTGETNSDDVTIAFQASTENERDVCHSKTNISATPPINGKGYWKVVGGYGLIEDKNQANTTVRSLLAGKHVLKWIYEGENCTATTRNTINVSNVFAGSDKTIGRSTTTLNATHLEYGSTGKWEVIRGAGFFMDSQDPITMVLGVEFGSNIYRWTEYFKTCKASDYLKVARPFVKADAGKEQYICSDSTTLNANIPEYGTGHWEIIEGNAKLEDPQKHNSKLYDLEDYVTLKWTVSRSGYTTSSEVDIVRQDIGKFTEDREETVTKNYVNLFGGGSYDNFFKRGEWKIIEGSGQLSSKSTYKTTITKLAEGKSIFEWTIYKLLPPNDQECKFSQKITIHREPIKPKASFDLPVEEACSPYILKCVNTSEPLDELTYSWHLNDGTEINGRDLEHKLINTDNEAKQIDITLRAETSLGNVSEYSKTLTLYPEKAIDFSANSTEGELQTFTFRSNNSSAKTYHWSFGDGSSSSLPEPLHKYTKEGRYSVTLLQKDEYGCSHEITKKDLINVSLDNK